MRKFTSLFILICAMSITTATAQINQTVVFNFANNTFSIPTEAETNWSGTSDVAEYNDGANTIKIDPSANNGKYFYGDGFVRLRKIGSKIILPAFNFNVDKIEVTGHKEAESYAGHGMNIFVGKHAVSTEVKGLTAEHTFEIAPEFQAEGNIYEIAVSSGEYVFITCIKVYPAASDNALTLEAPVLSNGTGVYTGPVTVAVSSSSTEIEGIEDVYFYYTTDGYEPDAECEEVEDGVITITKSCTLKVVLEFTHNEKTYTSESTTAEYIISEEVTYGKATTVAAGNYFIVANGNIALPFSNGVLPTKATTVANDCVTDAAYYAYSIEEDGNGMFYIKDANGKYLTASKISTKEEIKTSTTFHQTEWSIIIENGVAKICKEGYVLVYRNKAITVIREEEASTTEIYPSLYTQDGETAIESVAAETNDSTIYDLTGRRIEKITKAGIYIINGTKKIVK